MKDYLMPTFFLSHGGGPWPWLRKEMPFLDNLHTSLLDIVNKLREKPKAIIVVSGHWEEDIVSATSSLNPPMVYDYYGFPEFTYQIKYSAPGNPELALKIKELCKKNGIEIKLDQHRGYDHGVYSILYPMFPEANIPVIQLSMHKNYDPKFHFELGKALSGLRSEGVLLIGSGNIFHNLSRMNKAGDESHRFDQWIKSVLLNRDLDFRNNEILNWETAPFARYCQPKEDHLIPLFFSIGTGFNDYSEIVYGDTLFGNIYSSSYKFGN